MGSVDEIKMIMINEPEKLVIGSKRTIKYLKIGKVRKVFLARNAPASVRDDVFYYAKLAGIEVSELAVTNEELGAILGKPFNVAVVSLIK